MKTSHVFRTGARVLGYKLGRRFGWPLPMPLSLTLCLTGRCNSRCKTCNIWRNPPKNELSIDEWGSILKSMGKSPVWITVSEGEPFLRRGLVEFIRQVSEINQPSILNIATNGLLTRRIERDVREILSFHKEGLAINLSLDGIGERHDHIRGIKGNFSRLLQTIEELKSLKSESENLTLGINTTLSKYNIDQGHRIFTFVRDEVCPDSHLFEIADNRDALQNPEMELAPGLQEYTDLIRTVSREQASRSLTMFFRKRYYRLAEHMLEQQEQAIPCYAALASAQIMSSGEVWPCCRMRTLMGNLRESDYNFRAVWKSSQARQVREDIKRSRCWCTSVNANYTNILCSRRLFLG
jgi:MoaA/NifB/PqqE/SkfB family radical SAM enzyme